MKPVGKQVAVCCEPKCSNSALRVDGPPGGGDSHCRCIYNPRHLGPCKCEHGFTLPLRWGKW